MEYTPGWRVCDNHSYDDDDDDDNWSTVSINGTSRPTWTQVKVCYFTLLGHVAIEQQYEVDKSGVCITLVWQAVANETSWTNIGPNDYVNDFSKMALQRIFIDVFSE